MTRHSIGLNGGIRMQDKNNNNDDDNKDSKFNLVEESYDRYKAEISILAIIVFMVILLVFQLISYITDQDVLAPFPGLNFIITPISIAITFIVLYFIKKSNCIAKVLNLISNLLIWLKKYPIIYNIFRFAYKHPIISGFIVGTIGALAKNILL